LYILLYFVYFILCIFRYILYILYFVYFVIFCIFYTWYISLYLYILEFVYFVILCILYNLFISLYFVYFILCIFRYIMYILYFIYFVIFCIFYTSYISLYFVYFIICIFRYILYILYYYISFCQNKVNITMQCRTIILVVSMEYSNLRSALHQNQDIIWYCKMCGRQLLTFLYFIFQSFIRIFILTLRRLMSYIYIYYIYGAPILDVSRSHTTTQHSR